MPVIITPREEWGAVPPTEPPLPVKHPVENILIYPETQTKPCRTKKKCIKRMKEIQRYFMHVRELPDIKYNFLVGLDGRIYEGTGWHNRGHDSSISDIPELDHFISICYIGDFDDWVPPPEGADLVNRLIDFGITQGYIVKNYHDTLEYPYGEIMQ